jgi:hypothetical protein
MPAFDELRARYDADGYVIIRDLFSAAEIDELNAQSERYIREVVPTLPQDAAFHGDDSRVQPIGSHEQAVCLLDARCSTGGRADRISHASQGSPRGSSVAALVGPQF